jgi:hypothetical protein
MVASSLVVHTHGAARIVGRKFVLTIEPTNKIPNSTVEQIHGHRMDEAVLEGTFSHISPASIERFRNASCSSLSSISSVDLKNIALQCFPLWVVSSTRSLTVGEI